MNWLQLSDADRVAAVNVATRQLGFNANVIEKDWWVVMALKALFGSSIKDFASFKGGTSLSKGWGLIERFSEDADDYASMRENFIYGGALSYDDLIARLEVLQERIRQIRIDDPFFD